MHAEDASTGPVYELNVGSMNSRGVFDTGHILGSQAYCYSSEATVSEPVCYCRVIGACVLLPGYLLLLEITAPVEVQTKIPSKSRTALLLTI